MSSENRRFRRLVAKKARKGMVDFDREYYDNSGHVHQSELAAKVASFCNVFLGCLKNGFPIAVSKLWYEAWAFYPFFFIRKNLKMEDPIPVLNHERIHIRQQVDIHLTISIPLIMLSILTELFGWFNPLWILCIIPFIPTLIYGLEMLRVWRLMAIDVEDVSVLSFSKIRENTCFEREAISRSTNAEYLHSRKFWAVLAYTGWDIFKNYGMK